MRNSKISASMMCSNLIYLKKTINIFEQENIEYLHIDVMDGEFVPNLGLGVDYIRELRELTKIPLDLHLMVRSPECKLNWFGIKDTDIVTVHYESTSNVERTLERMRNYGCKCFLAINPVTPIYVLEETLDYIDGINLLMVNPGFAGQKMVQNTLKKAQNLQKFLHKLKKENIILEVDGNITEEHGRVLRKTGASIFVAGSSSIFRSGIDQLINNIRTFRKAIQ